LNIAAFTALALKDPIASLQILKRKFPAPGRARTAVMQIIIKVDVKVFLLHNYARQLEGLGGSAGIAAGILNSVLDGDVY
jgi:hypothetical protein